MKIQILQVAPTKDKAIASIEAELEKRISGFADLSTVTLQASKSDHRERCREEERERVLEKLDKDAYVIALSHTAKQLSSTEFAELVRDKRDFGPGRIQFLIGGSHGLHEDVLAAAHHQLSFSKMTFTHEMIRIFLKEQIYRAFAILAGKTYHK